MNFGDRLPRAQGGLLRSILPVVADLVAVTHRVIAAASSRLLSDAPRVSQPEWGRQVKDTRQRRCAAPANAPARKGS